MKRYKQKFKIFSINARRMSEKDLFKKEFNKTEKVNLYYMFMLFNLKRNATFHLYVNYKMHLNNYNSK